MIDRGEMSYHENSDREMEHQIVMKFDWHISPFCLPWALRVSDSECEMGRRQAHSDGSTSVNSQAKLGVRLPLSTWYHYTDKLTTKPKLI